VLKYIDERLAELDEEKSELEAYRVVELERRAIEHAYYERQYDDAVARLDECENQRAEELARAGDAHERAADARAELAQRETQLAGARRAAARHAAAVERLAAERSTLAERRAELALAASEADVDATTRAAELKRLGAELKQLRATIASSERKLSKAAPAADAANATAAELSGALQAGERRLTELYAKQGRAAQFKTAAARDKWLKQQLTIADAACSKHGAQAEAADAEVARVEAALAEATRRTTAREAGVEQRRAAGSSAAEALAKLREQRDTAAAQRKQLWRDDAAAAAALHDCRQELASAERALAGAVARPVAAGLAAVRRIAAEQRIDGVYGPLIELISAKPEFAPAIEVAARGALFHVVVASDDVAAQVLRAFNDEKVNGRVSFLPLNRLSAAPRDYPQSPDLRPLVDEIACEPMFAPAVRHVFGKTLLCRNLEVAAMNAKQHKLDCITLDGIVLCVCVGVCVRPSVRLRPSVNIDNWRVCVCCR
jgi:structural maintenance of chromosome 3 (chondroitin sulfate proteoglycan 6)